MRDRQIGRPAEISEIPVLSVLLHCVAMPGNVYLRSNFGYIFFRPKSIFFACSWAFALFCIYAWCEPGVWPRYRAVCSFGAGAAALYLLHLFRAIFQQYRGTALYDFDAGTSHLQRPLKFFKIRATHAVETLFHLWIDPGVVLIGAVVARYWYADYHLSLVLKYVALAMWLKELINHWTYIRQRKIQQDAFEDARDTVDPVIGDIDLPAKGTRKARVKRAREESP